MILKVLKIFIIVFPLSICCQNDKSFADKVNECYQDEKFEDIFYRMQNEKECYVNLKFPSFSLPDINGSEISNKDFEKKVVVITFWFTACPPCLKDIPEFNKLSDTFISEDVLFLAPSTDDADTINKFLKQYGPYKNVILPDSEDLFRNTLASKSGFPTTIVLNKQGVITEYLSSGKKDFQVLEQTIKELLVL